MIAAQGGTGYCKCMERNVAASIVSLVQGVVYVATGLWPILHRKSFEQVTGPKIDFWVVQTTGALISVIGSALMVAGVRRSAGSPETALLGIVSAASLAGADVIFTAKQRIREVYLLDAAGEAALILLWAAALALGKKK